jgi:hypothetical protein
MDFFEGFGSVFPYIVYLSIMWICILIGTKGQIKSILGLQPSIENKIERVSLKKENLEAVYFFTTSSDKKIAAKNEIKENSLHLGNNFTVQNISYAFYIDTSHIYGQFTDACGLRAPPIIL